MAEQFEYKTVGVTGVIDTSIQDGPGVVTAIVSVTGIKDNVNDVIEPGAYADSLTEITPKGAWHHDWTKPVSKTLMVKELMPLDPQLPRTFPNGEPWPKEAGALLVKMQFNLDTPHGAAAHSDVLFFGADQEWSIGYKVPEGGSRHQKDSSGGQTRYISRLKCYEYSPVLFGAMSAARTTSVKDAQLSFKSMMGEPLDAFLARLEEIKTVADDELETKGGYGASAYHGGGRPSGPVSGGGRSARDTSMDRYDPDTDGDDDSNDPDDDEDDDAPKPKGKRGRDVTEGGYSSDEKSLLQQLGISPVDLRQAINTMTKVLQFMDERKDGAAGPDEIEAESVEDAADAAQVEVDALAFDSTVDAVAAIVGLTDEQRTELTTLAAQFDRAEDEEEREALLDAIGAELDEAPSDEVYDGLRTAARVAGDQAETADGEKSSRVFGPEYKELATIRGVRARQETYLLQLKSTRPEVLAALANRYPSGSGMRQLVLSVKSNTTISEPADAFTIDTKALADLQALAAGE